MTAPVTVSITRHLDPGHEPEMVSWMQAGIALAERFPGFLGGGWVRPESGSETWHMLYRFADADALQSWEHSHERQWWRSSAAGLGVVESRIERRTGIEGWFDDPVTTEETDLRAAAAPVVPPRWKQACVIWSVFFPINLFAALLLREIAPNLEIVVRILITTVSLTPVMTYLALPFMTRKLGWWLQGQPAPWRRAATA